MNNGKGLDNLEIYTLSYMLSKQSRNIYKQFDYSTKKIIGDQFIIGIDSIGANISEGYGRFHYLDSAKFYYNARGFLFESIHWIKILRERNIINEDNFKKLTQQTDILGKKLNNFINSIKQRI